MGQRELGAGGEGAAADLRGLLLVRVDPNPNPNPNPNPHPHPNPNFNPSQLTCVVSSSLHDSLSALDGPPPRSASSARMWSLNSTLMSMSLDGMGAGAYMDRLIDRQTDE